MRHRLPRSSTQLNYRDGGEHEPQVIQKESIEDLQDEEAAKWWRSVFQPAPAPSHEDEEQQVVDQYLEFLDKRYKRLHEKEKKKPEPATNKFSALSWLTADKSDPIAQHQEEDALYVLGVAELASERLLQKHQAALHQPKRKVPAEEMKKENEVVIDAVAESETVEDTDVVLDESSKVRKAFAFATLAEVGRKVLKNVSDRRNALIAYQEKKAVSALLLAFKTTLGAPVKGAKLLWNLGGGKKTIALTATAFITVFLVVRPVAQAVVANGATSYSR